jgi:hypothetical protein
MSDDLTDTKQEFLAELESIIESDEAYGSNVQILNWGRQDNTLSGKFKDSWNNRVYEFIIDIDSISYKPAARLDSFSNDELSARFDAYSKGYTSLFVDTRLDGKLTGKRVKRPKCGATAYGCGYSCIGLQKTCRILNSGKKAGANQGKAIGKERLNKLFALANKALGARDGTKFSALNAVAGNIAKARNEHAKGPWTRAEKRETER